MIRSQPSAVRSGMATSYRFILLFAVLLEAAFLSLHRLENFKLQAVEFITTYLLASLLYLVCCFLITNSGADGTLPRRWMSLIWGAGILFRLTVFPLDPMLSEDLNRYRWQGKLQAAGGNPYTEVPQDPRWESLRDATYPSVNRKDLPSVYGPVLERFYAAYYRLVSALQPDVRSQVWWFKAPFALFEIAVAMALGGLLTAMGLPSQWLLIYLWSPLTIVEFWAQGHNDAVAVLFMVLALTAALKQRWVWGWTWLTLAALTKFWPAILFPFFLVQRDGGHLRFRHRAALVFIPIALAVSWPYLDGISKVEEILAGFVGGWRNNDSLYSLIYWAVGEDFNAGTTWVKRLLAGGLVLLWANHLWGRSPWRKLGWTSPGVADYSEAETRAAKTQAADARAENMRVEVVQAANIRAPNLHEHVETALPAREPKFAQAGSLSLIRSSKWAVLLLLFLAANCFPWYLSWLLPFLVIFPNAALLLWTALVSLSYHILIRYELLGVWQETDEFRLMEYVPVYTMLIGSALWRLAMSARARRVLSGGTAEP